MKTPEYNYAYSETLKELCKKHFPEYKKIEFQDEYVFFHTEEGVKKIHWFQLCFTELSARIIKFNAKITGDMAYTTKLGTIHPVNFLYRMDKNGTWC